MAEIIGLFVAGISRGMIYFLLSSGLTLVFGVLGLLNFAHGTFYMVGVFLCFSVVGWLNFGFAFLIVPAVLVILGAIFEIGLLRRIYKAEHIIQLLLTTGLVFILSDVVKLIWGLEPKSISMPGALRGFVNVLGIIIPIYNLFIIAVSTIILLAMLRILYRTKVGSFIRACQIDPDLALATGINYGRVCLLVFTIGCALAGLTAVCAAPMVTAILGMDSHIIIVAFIIVIIGGVGSIKGVLVASLIIGIVESIGISFLPLFSEAFLYAIVVLTLAVRPQGLFGQA